MSYEENEVRDTSHSDAKKNIAYYLEKIKRVEWLNDTLPEPVRDGSDWLAITFIWGRGPEKLDAPDKGPYDMDFYPLPPERKGSFHISFHQPHREFRVEFCDCMNGMYALGLIKIKSPSYKQMKDGLF